MHEYNADDLIVQQHFDGVATLTDVYEAMLNNASQPNPGALSFVLYGDWNTIEQGDDRTHGADMGTFHFIRDADILSRWAADVTRNESAQAKYAAVAATARATYRALFFDAKHVGFTDPVYYGSRFPAISQIIALALGGVTASDAEAKAVFANFLAGLAAGDDVGIANASVWASAGACARTRELARVRLRDCCRCLLTRSPRPRAPLACAGHHRPEARLPGLLGLRPRGLCARPAALDKNPEPRVLDRGVLCRRRPHWCYNALGVVEDERHGRRRV